MNLPEPTYYFDRENRFVIQNYQWAKTFSNFLPGIAGKWGIPLWIYYVSRGQAISSMGIHNKDHAIMEFLSFNKACQVVGQQGFRTFLKIGDQSLYEPFQKSADIQIRQNMFISPHEFEIEEINPTFGIQTSVTYFPLPGLPISGMVRKLNLHNMTSRIQNLELIDGLAKILPYGVEFEHMKVIPRHIEGMMGVHKFSGFALFRLKQTPADIDRVGEISGGNYYLSYDAAAGNLSDHHILDPYPVFGDSECYDHPWRFGFLNLDGVLSSNQVLENRTPCAMTGRKIELKPGETYRLYSVIGYSPTDDSLSVILDQLDESWLRSKRKENEQLITGVRETALTASSNPVFDLYCQQTFLENVMRGGMPVQLKGNLENRNFYVYHRQNGDLERDYHWFILEPTYLSQGNSHYRNILQNRRSDTWFFPFVKDENLFRLANLIQLDGYNPLEVNGITFTMNAPVQAEKILEEIPAKPADKQTILALMKTPFSPGELAYQLEQTLDMPQENIEPLLVDLLSACRENEIGGIYEGFWIDHWFYLLDMIESIYRIYPDQIADFLLENRNYTYYDNPDRIVSRSQKTVHTDRGYRQYGAVIRDEKKIEMLASRKEYPKKVRTEKGIGKIYYTNLLEKMLCIILCRLAALDSRGYGVEMEAGKPGWCDSLNGLPGLFGSSICETLEIIRACRLLVKCLSQPELDHNRTQSIFIELFHFWASLDDVLPKLSEDPQQYWEKSRDLLEDYRSDTRYGIKGETHNTSLTQILSFLERSAFMLQQHLENAPRADLYHPNQIPYTYFINTLETMHQISALPGDHEQVAGESARSYSFHSSPLALFLEGPVHTLRVFPDKAGKIYSAVRSSSLYDRKLKMYKNCESLKDQPLEIGRIKAYADGWLENGSIYTHMEYKWLLEILKSGLHDEFFQEIPHSLVPFMDPQFYGRSTLENCSFIVSSEFPDPLLHGQAFQPRLSGMTCEFLEMWTIMTAGKQPFSIDRNGDLQLELAPVLPAWFFTKTDTKTEYLDSQGYPTEMLQPKNSFSFRFLGHILTTYHNPDRKPTFGDGKAAIQRYTIHFTDGDIEVIDGNIIPTSAAQRIRSLQASSITAELR